MKARHVVEPIILILALAISLGISLLRKEFDTAEAYDEWYLFMYPWILNGLTLILVFFYLLLFPVGDKTVKEYIAPLLQIHPFFGIMALILEGLSYCFLFVLPGAADKWHDPSLATAATVFNCFPGVLVLLVTFIVFFINANEVSELIGANSSAFLLP